MNIPALLILTLLATPLANASTDDSASTPALIAIQAARLYDGTGAPALSDATVIIRGNRILQVGRDGEVDIPEGAEVLDLGDSTLMPGLFDTHGHLRYRYAGGGAAGRHAQATGDGGFLGMRMVKNARTQLLSGVTTMRMTGEVAFLDFAVKRAIDSGMVPGPRIIPSGRLITTEGGHGGYTEASQVDGPWEVRQRVRENFHQGARLIKFSMVDLSPEGAEMTAEEINAGVDEAHKAGLPATVHCTGNWGSCIRLSIAAGADTIEHARPLTDDIIDDLARHGTSLSLTPLVYIGFRPSERWWHYVDHEATSGSDWIQFLRREMRDWRAAHPEWETHDRPYADNDSNRASRDFFPAVRKRQDQVRKAWEAGIPIGLGLDTLYGGITVTMEWMVEAGIPLKDVIHMATGSAARISRVDDRLGTLEPGKLADIIAVKGDPARDIAHLHQLGLVMKNGQRVDTLSWN